MKHKVIIREVLQKEIEVEADNPQDAFDIVNKEYKKTEIVLDYDDHINTDIFLEDEEPIPVLYISKEDFRMQQLICENLKISAIKRLANNMSDYLMEDFWSILQNFKVKHNIKSQQDIIEEAEKIMEERYHDFKDDTISDIMKEKYQEVFNIFCDKLEKKYNKIIIK